MHVFPNLVTYFSVLYNYVLYFIVVICTYIAAVGLLLECPDGELGCFNPPSSEREGNS